jgi:SAM-dependent methyltransferase
MQYDPIKKSLGSLFSGSAFMRKFFYFLLDLLLLRTWHIKRTLRKISASLNGQVSVLDAGAGFGQYTWRMKRLHPDWQVKAVDIDQERIDDCEHFFRKARIKGVICEKGDLSELADSENYNLILSVDVMEHIRDDEQVFRNFHRALKPGGILLISTPSDRGGSDVRSKDDHSFIDEHVRDGYGKEEITGRLKGAGFSKVDVSYTYGVPGTVSWRITMKYPVMMLGLSKLFFLVLPFYYLLTFPFALVLNFLDVSMIHKSGTGLLVTACR